MRWSVSRLKPGTEEVELVGHVDAFTRTAAVGEAVIRFSEKVNAGTAIIESAPAKMKDDKG